MNRTSTLLSLGLTVSLGSAVACSSSNAGKAANAGGSAGISGSGNATGAAGSGTGNTSSSGGATSSSGGATAVGNGGIPPIGLGGAAPLGNGGRTGSGGTNTAGTPPVTGGATGAGGTAPAAGGSAGAAGAPPTSCTSTSPVGPTVFGMFAQADPSKKGSYAVTTATSVGPMMAYTMYRPTDLTKGGPLFPVVTWGNGTGTTPPTYSFLLSLLASHGFIVIASNSMNVAQGTPPPMLDGVTWVFQQNCDSASPLYQHVDTAHVGATGHSQGAFATMTAGTDPRIVATAPIEGSLPAKLHGPSLLLCGGMDTTVGCMGAQSAFTSITGEPLMYAQLIPASHTSWITDSITAQFGGGAPSPFVTAVVGWMRVFLMNDASLKPMFFGPTCTLCKDTTNWMIQQKMLD